MHREPRFWVRQRWWIIYHAQRASLPGNEIAELVGVSARTVRRVLAAYNREGPAALETLGSGGRHHAHLDWEQESLLLAELSERAKLGELTTIEQIRTAVEASMLDAFPAQVQAALATRDPTDQRPVRKMAQDESRFGRISRPRRSWAPPGMHPRAARQHVRESIYVYAAVAPEQGEVISLILPEGSTAMMQLFLDHVSASYADSFLVMQLDQAAWHQTKELRVEDEYPPDHSARL
jgi:hypothetical protein